MSKTIDELALEYAGGKTLDELRAMQTVPFSSPVSTATGEQTEYEREYWKNVWNTRKAAANDQEVPTRARIFEREKSLVNPGQPMQYEEAKALFMEVLTERGNQIAVTRNDPNFKWRFSDKDGVIIKNLIRYFINDPASIYPLNKAPFFYGGYGTGKTELMMAFQVFCEKNAFQKAFKLSSMSEIHHRIKTNKEYNPLDENLMYDRCFDELVNWKVKRMGDDVMIAETIIELREKRFIRYGQLTMFTANCAPNELQNHVSPMIFDRITHMCFSVHFEGESKRGKNNG